jgi:(1->4)-alpha-D-glucan 1-alpha-D-glucosylmutase
VLEVVVPLGRVNSLTQTLCKLTAPGVPDVYQGCEVWDLSLVDPDNRRPVDHDRIGALLADLDTASPEAVLARMDEGAPKLWVTRQVLRLRRDRPELFATDCTPLLATGARHDHVIAYRRGRDVVVVAPRHTLALGSADVNGWDWQDTTLRLPDGRWHDHLSGARHDGGPTEVAALLGRFPGAVLVPEEAA